MADQAEHAFRAMGRLLSAAQPFSFLDKTPKLECLRDFQLLLGGLCDVSKLPVKGGRQAIAGGQSLHAGPLPVRLSPDVPLQLLW